MLASCRVLQFQIRVRFPAFLEFSPPTRTEIQIPISDEHMFQFGGLTNHRLIILIIDYMYILHRFTVNIYYYYIQA